VNPATGKAGLPYRAGYEFARWLHAPGWPPYYPSTAAGNVLSGPAEALAAAWLGAANGEAGATAATIAEPAIPTVPHGAFAGWPTFQKLHFLDTLLGAAGKAEAGARVTPPLMAGLDAAYGLSTSRNAEVRLRWSQLICTMGWAPGYACVLAYLSSQGKQKFSVPVYTAMVTGPLHDAAAKGDAGAAAAAAALRDLAVRTFAATRAQLHMILVAKVVRVLASHGLAVEQ
jgi:aminopeptidase B